MGPLLRSLTHQTSPPSKWSRPHILARSLECEQAHQSEGNAVAVTSALMKRLKNQRLIATDTEISSINIGRIQPFAEVSQTFTPNGKHPLQVRVMLLLDRFGSWAFHRFPGRIHARRITCTVHGRSDLVHPFGLKHKLRQLCPTEDAPEMED